MQHVIFCHEHHKQMHIRKYKNNNMIAFSMTPL